jgi:hypothetical protein
MEDECKLLIENKCSKFGISCSGWREDKEKCPVWGEVLAAENYFSERSKYERGVHDEEDEAKAEEWRELCKQHKESLAYQVNNGTIDWKIIKGVFDMRSERIAKNYVTSSLKTEGLICCMNCAKWTKDEICKESKQKTDATFTCKNFAKLRS